MEIFSRNLNVDASMCDASGRLGVWNAFALFQDAASEHAERMGIGGAAMFARNAFWITVRTRVRFYKRPAMQQQIAVSTWPARPGATRTDRFYRMTRGDEVVAEGRTEWCVLDTVKKTVRTMDSIGLDENLAYSAEVVCPEPYARFKHDFTDENCVLHAAVRPSDIDLGQHMNNVAYLRLLTDSFSVAEMQKLRVSEMEIIFMSSCFEGEVLDVLRRETEYGYEFGVRRADGKYAALALLRTK